MKKDARRTQPNKLDQEKLVAETPRDILDCECDKTIIVSKPNHIPLKRRVECAGYGDEHGEHNEGCATAAPSSRTGIRG